MKIVLENVVYSRKNKRGIGNYFQNLVSKLSERDTVNEYVLFNYFLKDYAAKRREVLCVDKKNFSNCVRRFPQRAAEFLEWRLGIPVTGALLPPGADLYHGIEARLPKLPKGIKTVVTICDLIIELFPEWNVHHPTHILKDACTRADHLIAISENTKKDIVKIYSVPAEKISVVELGSDLSTFTIIKDRERLESVRARCRLPERFLLSTGPFEPRRNTERLLEVFASLGATPSGKALALVLPGSKNWYFDRILKKIRELGLEDKVLLPGFVPNEDLAALYALAELFVYPSLYEGWGLALSEAMACGAAIVSSSAASMPEVVGDAAVLIDPNDSEALKAAILGLLEDRPRRDRLKAKGPERAKLFTWEETARKTLAVYEKVAKGSRP